MTLATEITGKVRAAWNLATGLHHERSPAFLEELALLQKNMLERWAGKQPADIPVLAPARELYRSIGMDPTRTRPSSEALLRRVLQGKGLYRLDAIVDTGNLFSLAHSLPLGLYDLAHITGDVTLRLGREQESFAGIRKGHVNVARRLCLADDRGPFGSPSSDSERCRIRDETTDILFLIYAPFSYDETELLEHGEELTGNFVRWHGGSGAQPRLLDSGRNQDR